MVLTYFGYLFHVVCQNTLNIGSLVIALEFLKFYATDINIFMTLNKVFNLAQGLQSGRILVEISTNFDLLRVTFVIFDRQVAVNCD